MLISVFPNRQFVQSIARIQPSFGFGTSARISASTYFGVRTQSAKNAENRDAFGG